MKAELHVFLLCLTVYYTSGVAIPKSNKVKGDPLTRATASRGVKRMAPGGPPAPYSPDLIKDVSEATFNSIKTHICNSVPTLNPEKLEANLSLSAEMTEAEVFELAMTNMAHDMTSDSILVFLPENIRWMKQVMDLISSITMMTCSSEVVPVTYVNVAKNLFMYYLYKNSRQESTIDPVSGQEVPKANPDQGIWDSIVDMLTTCNDDITTLTITQECKIANYVMQKDGSMSLISIPEEQYDVNNRMEGGEHGEEVIDAAWMMFSTAYARCYAFQYPNEAILLNFLEEFITEFLKPLYPRWRMMGNAYNEFFPLIMGPFDLSIAKGNLRACAAAAYMYEGIGDRQLVRPLPVEIDENILPNFKTGRSLF